MTQASGEPTFVEILLPDALVAARLAQISESRRLVDVLNSVDQAIQLQDVSLTLGSGRQVHNLATLSIEKDRILMAMPRETAEQVRLRQIYRTGISPRQQAPLDVALFLPPYYLEGTARLPAGAATALERSVFSQFFVVTDATIWREDGAHRSEATVVVARNQVAALGRKSDAIA